MECVYNKTHIVLVVVIMTSFSTSSKNSKLGLKHNLINWFEEKTRKCKNEVGAGQSKKSSEVEVWDEDGNKVVE
jgi:hypothetical protein